MIPSQRVKEKYIRGPREFSMPKKKSFFLLIIMTLFTLQIQPLSETTKTICKIITGLALDGIAVKILIDNLDDHRFWTNVDSYENGITILGTKQKVGIADIKHRFDTNSEYKRVLCEGIAKRTSLTYQELSSFTMEERVFKNLFELAATKDDRWYVEAKDYGGIWMLVVGTWLAVNNGYKLYKLHVKKEKGDEEKEKEAEKEDEKEA